MRERYFIAHLKMFVYMRLISPSKFFLSLFRYIYVGAIGSKEGPALHFSRHCYKKFFVVLQQTNTFMSRSTFLINFFLVFIKKMHLFLLNFILLGITSNQINAEKKASFCTTTVACIEKIKRIVPETDRFWFGDQHKLQCESRLSPRLRVVNSK